MINLGCGPIPEIKIPVFKIFNEFYFIYIFFNYKFLINMIF